MASELVIDVRSEPPKFYFDDLERSRTIEFVTYKTVIREVQNEHNKG